MFSEINNILVLDMKQEELFVALIKELFTADTTQQEYQDNDIHFVVDSKREGNTLNIKVELIGNKDKEEFEDWLKQVDDSLLEEVFDELGKKEGLSNLQELYETEDYQQVIDAVKAKTREIAAKKIKSYKRLFS